MREIKFRAWDGEYMLTYADTSLTCVNFGGLVGYADGEGDFVEEKNLILMQYTGLKDKNGKEIYEGDIIKVVFFDNKVDDFLVCFDKERARFNLVDCRGDWWSLTQDNDMEVIGNIYENPELLDK